MSIVSTTKMTAEQFLQLGEDPPGIRLELVNGEVAVSPSPVPNHSHVIFVLSGILYQFNLVHDVGEFFSDVDTVLDPLLVRRPDILFFSHGRTNLIGKKSMQGPPDLAVEVISPSSVEIDREDKFAEYRDARVMHYWIVDPADRTFEGWSLINGQYVPTGRGQGVGTISLPPFPTLEIPLIQLWRK